MPFKKHDRQYDLVVFGATGYTGQMAAEYVTMNFPTNLKWAIAGRSEAKLQDLIRECKKLNPDRDPPHVEVTSVDDASKVNALVKKTFVMITTVGPYCLWGEKAVKACAESGTHYLDITGEVVWVHSMIKKYEQAAKASGAILIPQIGMESAPADLSTWALAGAIRKQLGAKTRDVTISLHNIRASPSGGTLATALTLFDHFSLEQLKESAAPYALSPVPHPAEPKRPKLSIAHLLLGVHNVPNLGMVTTSFTGSTDRSEVERSWGLLSQIPSRKDEFYGPNFHWVEYQKVRNWLHGFAIHWMLVIISALLVFVPPARALGKRIVIAQGTGPSKEDMEKEEVEYRGVATPDAEELSTKQAFSRAWFHGSMYLLSAKFAAEAARTILEDDLKLDGGFLTPCCLGQGFIDRMHTAGFKIEIKIQDK